MVGPGSDEKRKQLVKHYRSLMDGELEELAREGDALTDDARASLRAEIARRGLAVIVKEPEPASPEPERGEIITVQIFNDVSSALIAKTILESAGIECLVSNESIIRTDGVSAVGGIRLQVAQRNAAAAAALLEAEIPENFMVTGVGEFVQPRCPGCNSLDVSCEGLPERETNTRLFAAMPVTGNEGMWKCNDCGLEWPESKPGESSPGSA